MLWLERQVVATLTADLDPGQQAAVEAYVDGVLSVMPEHLRLGVAGESIVLGGGVWLARRAGSQRPLAEWLVAWEHSRVGPIRQYVRLLSSLVIFSIEELAPDQHAGARMATGVGDA